MGAACSICPREDRPAIDADIVAGAPNRAIARQYDVGKDAVARHRANHISGALARVISEREEAGPRTALDRLEELHGRAMRVLDAAETEGKASLSLAAIRELRSLTETLAKITGELDERPNVQVLNVATSPEWLALRAGLMDALAPYPEAAQAVAGRLLALESGVL